MRTADLVVTGTVVTVDQLQPTAEAMAVSDGRIIAVGDRSGIERWIGPDTEVLDTGDGCVMPGFVEAHGHPLMEAIVLSDRMVDIRPVTIRNADDVVDAVRREVAKRGAQGAYLNGWDPLLQNGLPDPTLAWLNDLAPETPLVIVHNSGHKAYFNSATAGRAGLTRDTPDPKGASYGRDADGDLDGTAEEIQAVFSLLGGAIQPSDYPAMLRAEMARLNRGGLTTCSEMAFDPAFRPVVEQMRSDLTVRLRPYEISNAQMSTDMTPDKAKTCSARPGSRSGSTAHRGSATSTRPFRTWTPTPPAASVSLRDRADAPTTPMSSSPRSSRRTFRGAGRWRVTSRATGASTPSSTCTKTCCAGTPVPTIGYGSNTSAPSDP